ncbi:hypothetical protein V6N11_004456 [Hibiscus sabdariffa]|uniref:VQ domain-containing protein n=1 Tax=Hibiscus sabdariffa TaxID=183260 RepID=A0ABR2SGM4_9ROSI
MNGARPSPLKINKESHLIQKPSSSSADHHHQPQQQRRQGLVIIYAHSPKIIHTQARDFMALVQRLTGLSRPDRQVNDNTAAVLPRKNDNRQEDNESSSAITDETVGDFNNNNNNNNNNICSSNVPTSVSALNPFFADMPLFTPGSTDFFCSPRPVHKFGDTGTLNSPTLLEFMKGLPDY